MNKNKLTVLVVDDNEVNRKILRRLLLDEYEVAEAENGKQALAILSSFSDEFIVFIPAVENVDYLLKKSNQLCDILNRVQYTENALKLSVSIGISLSDKTGNYIELYKKADSALYEAKKTENHRQSFTLINNRRWF